MLIVLEKFQLTGGLFLPGGRRFLPPPPVVEEGFRFRAPAAERVILESIRVIKCKSIFIAPELQL